MRILADANIHGEVVRRLRDLAHDVTWVAERSSDPGDVSVLAEANSQDRLLLTHDKGFGSLVVVQGLAHRGVVLADVAPGIDLQIALIVAFLSRRSDLLDRGAFVRLSADGSVRVLGGQRGT